MNAQAQADWKFEYKVFRSFRKLDPDGQYTWNRDDLRDLRRAAALERKLEAAQRKIDKQDHRIGELEQMLKLYMDGLPTGPLGYTSWPVAPLHIMARNVLNR